jgi:serine O-acetyltransferase
MDPTIACDLYRYAGKVGFRPLLTHLIFSPGFKFTYVFRKLKMHGRGSLPWLIYRLLYHRYIHKYGFQIPLSAKIGKGLYITHFGSVVVHGDAILGDNCDLAHGITIGQASRGERKGCPIIGNKVWIGTGAVVVGNITVGDNVMIAPNAFVNFDVPSNSIVLGNPGKVIAKEDATLGYINRVLEPLPASIEPE